MTTTYTKEEKPVDRRLLKEDTFFLLLETGDKILIARATEYTKEAKP